MEPMVGFVKAGKLFYNARHTFISIALTLGCNQKWIAEQTGTSIAMLQEHYGKDIRDDGDGPVTGTFSRQYSSYQINLASPTGFEPVLSA